MNTDMISFLDSLPSIDAAQLELRASEITNRPVEPSRRLPLIELAIGFVDLTTLEGSDTSSKVEALASRAIAPDAATSCPPTAAVCVFGALAGAARRVLDASGTTVRVACVAGGFPHGRMSLATKLADVRDAIAQGAQEIDMVIDRGAFNEGRYDIVFGEIEAIASVCHEQDVILKVILETGELADYDAINRASWIAMRAGADFIKTSTGKIPAAATAPGVMVMLQAVRDFYELTGRRVGVKPAGGIRTTDQALGHLELVAAIAGPEWLHPSLYRIGASALLGDLVAQRSAMILGTNADVAEAGSDY